LIALAKALIFGLIYRFTICNKGDIRYNLKHG
jgi:hypothetical protein